MGCSFEWESRLQEQGCSRVAGIDEAGRGPLAGPVVAAAVVLPQGFCCAELDDSKKLRPATREHLFEHLRSLPGVMIGVAVVDAAEIDRLNILRATHEAMRRACAALSTPPDHVLIDGLPVRPFPFAQTALVKGDGVSWSIAAASVIAKVTRDRMMLELDRIFPQYGFAKHKGYGTRLHLEQLNTHGPCPAHRKSFAPVAQTTFCFDAP